MASKLISSTLLRQYLTKSTRHHPFSTATAAAAGTTEPHHEESGGRPFCLDIDPDTLFPWYISQFLKPFNSRTFIPPSVWRPAVVERARSQVATLIGASPKEIVFTSGATESNNISIKGFMQHFYNKEKEKKKHVVITTTTTTQTEESKCVLDSCQHEGFDVTYLPVEKDGLVDLEKLRDAIRSDTGLVSVNMVVNNNNNNEFGVFQPMEEIGKICKEFNVPFHTQAALGKVPIDVDKWNVSLMSLSGDQKGVGALYMRTMIGVEPQMNMNGDGQVERHLVVDMGAACQAAMEYDEKRTSALYCSIGGGRKLIAIGQVEPTSLYEEGIDFK